MDRLARLELLELARAAGARYARAVDAKDLDVLRSDVFTADAVLRTTRAEYTGIDDVMAFYDTAFAQQPGARRHFLTNHEAEVGDDGRVTVDCYFFFLSADARSVIGWGTYHDVVVVTDGIARLP